MKKLPKISSIVRWFAISSLSLGLLQAAPGDVTPLNKAELGRVEAVLAKNLKGKPTVQSGTKQEIDGGWKFNVVANVGSGGAFDLVVMTEKSMTLGYIESQTPKSVPAKGKT